MDMATIIGILSGVSLILASIATGPSPIIFLNIPSVLIVIGGTVATTFIRFPMRIVFSTAKVMRNAFVDKHNPVPDLIEEIVRLAEKSRRDSLLSLESVPISDSFLAKGVQLCVDGTEPEVVRSTLRTELEAVIERHKRGQRILRSMGTSAPAFGMIGTLIGLVQMLTKMDDPSAIGPSMAVAILTTLYGALIANLICIPMADKLSERTTVEMQGKEIVIQGIMGILAANHPGIVRERLLSFIEPRTRDRVASQTSRRQAA
ncbi:MAG: MotA/TolQ/ExbB proton channel family protein [Candidatus Eisenbacteria bacterium]